MMALWDSVTDLRQVEWVAVLVIMIAPLVGGTILLTARYRIKVLLNQAKASADYSQSENVKQLQDEIRHLDSELVNTRRELAALRQATAPRALSEAEERQIVAQLQGVKASPVIVCAYAMEDESYRYASQIAGALRQAGWEVTLNKASMNDFKGVTLGAVNLMQRPLLGQGELSNALRAAHVDLHPREVPQDSIAGPLQDGALLVVVGRK